MSMILKRYNSVRRADALDDQKTPHQIVNAHTNSVTQEDLQEYLLSQVRQIIHGTTGPHWFEDFGSQGILSLKEVTQYLATYGNLAGHFREGVSLGGVKNGVNRVFDTGGELFIHEPNGRSIEVFHNGRKLVRSVSGLPDTGDYMVAEASGPGTGYNLIKLLTFAPIERSSLTASYQLSI